ncbi:HpcH/HpaI aldolase/citrate lyase family protein [Hwanghaeella sp.]|uniref:HpcH/HpaI aldolase/citrate lyase family protein n=1 Tax=Hwanghaeella sp. TaxID=2605943 RepID=UPI003CCBD6EE
MADRNSGMDLDKIRPRRSFLFVPGSGLGMFPKAIATGADIVCIDLEDAIAPAHKETSRKDTMALFGTDPDFGRSEVLIRVNSLRSTDGFADILAVAETPTPPTGLMLPKVKSPDEIRLLDELLDSVNSPLRLQVIIETNEALEAAHEIAKASTRIDSLLFGGVDMAAELRVEPNWEGLLYARTRCVHAAASAGVDLIDVPFLDLNDMNGLAEAAKRAAAIGMTGKGAIHPKQLPVIEKTFSPSAEAIAYARRCIAAFEEAGTGLVVVDNKLLEKPVLRSMYRVLAVAEVLEGSGA